MISIVIPTYNEENNIGHVLADIRENFQGQDYEIIVVDDGSVDNTFEKLKAEKNIILIRNNKNRGYGKSIKIGVERSSGEIIIMMDADGQHKAKER